MLIAVGCVTVNEFVALQEFASATVTVYVPAASDEISSVNAELLQAYVKTPVPPDAVISIAPVDCPKQLMSVITLGIAITAGSFNITLPT